MSKKQSVRHGFTIVELLIVVVIIAVLAAITVAAFNGVQRRANESASASGASTAVKKIELYKGVNGTYPATLADVAFSPAGGTSYQYYVDGTSANYCVTATTNNVSMYSNSSTPAPQKGGCAGHTVDGVAPITNYVLNPSVENGLTGGWSGDGSVMTSMAYQGTKSMTYTGAATPLDKAIYLTVAVPSAGTYYVSAYVYITGSANSFTGGTSYGRDAMWLIGPWVYANYNRTLLNQWQRIQASGTMATAGNLQLRFYPPGGATIYVDNVMVTTTSSGYADGNTSGWMWNGTAHNSTSSGQS